MLYCSVTKVADVCELWGGCMLLINELIFWPNFPACSYGFSHKFKRLVLKLGDEGGKGFGSQGKSTAGPVFPWFPHFRQSDISALNEWRLWLVHQLISWSFTPLSKFDFMKFYYPVRLNSKVIVRWHKYFCFVVEVKGDICHTLATSFFFPACFIFTSGTWTPFNMVVMCTMPCEWHGDGSFSWRVTSLVCSKMVWLQKRYKKTAVLCQEETMPQSPGEGPSLAGTAIKKICGAQQYSLYLCRTCSERIPIQPPAVWILLLFFIVLWHFTDMESCVNRYDVICGGVPFLMRSHWNQTHRVKMFQAALYGHGRAFGTRGLIPDEIMDCCIWRMDLTSLNISKCRVSGRLSMLYVSVLLCIHISMQFSSCALKQWFHFRS